jgi:putative membrane-bound dehydrogenase-like protein
LLAVAPTGETAGKLAGYTSARSWYKPPRHLSRPMVSTRHPNVAPRSSALVVTRCAVLCIALVLSNDLRADDPPPRSPEETVKAFSLPPGFKATLFAGEPDVVQPIGMAFDDRGRLWIAENLSYPNWQPTGHDRITIFEDTDGDGRFDRKTLFYDKLNYVTGLEVGFGGVWVVSAPNLLFIPDRDRDDKPDEPPQVLLDGFGHQGVHNLVTGCVWGPDGWLYGGHGGSSSGDIGKPGAPATERVFFDGGVWRYHPTKHKFEVFMRGTTNPWGLDFDELGQAFISNSVTPHLYQVIQGAHVERRKDSPSNRYAYDVIQSIADHRHWVGADWTQSRGGKPEQIVLGGGHAHCGLMIYLGDAWPDEYRGRIYINNIHGDRMNVDLPEQKGSGFVAHHGRDFLACSDPWYQALQIRYGPDGNVYLTDWYDTGECHTRKPDRKSGRIYKISYVNGGTPKPKPVQVDVSKLSDVEVGSLLQHHNEWFARHAQRVLQERAAARKLSFEVVTPALVGELERGEDVHLKLRALWALNAVGWFSSEVDVEGYLGTFLEAQEAYLRAWAIRIAAEDGHLEEPRLEMFRQLAKSDPSPVVRLHLASAVQRLPIDQRWAIVEALAAHDEDATDQNLPLMVWYALEPLVKLDPERALRMVLHSKLPRIREFVARRIATQD